MKKHLPKLIIVALMILTFFGLRFFGPEELLSLESIKHRQFELQSFYRKNPSAALWGYFLIYVIMTTLSFPGATVMTLAGAAIFGFWTTLLLVSFSSTFGASGAFLLSRYLFRDWVQRRFSGHLEKFNRGVEKDGLFYLFSLRMIPIVPFWVINIVSGLTGLRLIPYFLVSQLGMLAGTAVYVNAGVQLSSIERVSDIMSVKVMGAFALLGLFPLVVRKLMGKRGVDDHSPGV